MAKIQIDIPKFDLADEVWRRQCMTNASIPSGYTYLAQLMGHDIGNSVPANTVPHTHLGDEASTERRSSTYNLIENPLCFETIYGKGPAGTPHLFSPATFLFRIRPDSELSELLVLPGDENPVPPNVIPNRLLADLRNRDTSILHRLTVIWMQYHNLVAKALIRQEIPNIRDNEYKNLPKNFLLSIYAQSRTIVLKTWHQIVASDLLPTFCHSGVMAIDKSDISTIEPLGTQETLQGIMRSFHSLPLQQYHLDADNRPLLKEIRNPLLENAWGLNWGFFFGDDASNKTRLSASYTSQFSSRTHKRIILADLATAQKAGATAEFSHLLEKANTILPKSIQPDLRPQTLADLMNNASSKSTEKSIRVTAEEISKVPLFLLLQMEAQFYGEDGGFGPLGSILLRRYLENLMDNVIIAEPTLSIVQWRPPQTMLDVINTVHQHSNGV